MSPVLARTPHIHFHRPSPRSGPISVNDLSSGLNFITKSLISDNFDEDLYCRTLHFAKVAID